MPYSHKKQQYKRYVIGIVQNLKTIIIPKIPQNVY